MDGSLHDRDFHAWTREQAAALRRLAETRPNLDAGLDLPNLIEEVEDLGSEQVHRVESNLRRLMQHLIYLARQPQARTTRHWTAEALTFRHAASLRPGSANRSPTSLPPARSPWTSCWTRTFPSTSFSPA